MKKSVFIIALSIGILIFNVINGNAFVRRSTDDPYPGCIACWHFDEGDGNITRDSCGDNDGIVDKAIWTKGINGYALQFEDNGIVYGISSKFDDSINSSLSIECWIYWYGYHNDTYSPKSYIMDARDLEWPCGGFIFYIDKTAHLVFLLYDNEKNAEKVVSNAIITPDKWTHVAAILDYENHKIELSINGEIDNYAPAVFPYHDFGGSHLDVAIGNNRYAPFDGEWAPFNGIIDELYIYNHAFSPPATPDKPSGPTPGKIWHFYRYYSHTTDPYGLPLYYMFDWGDGSSTGWLGPYNSGDIVKATHIWLFPGNYEIRVKAKNIFGLESEWSPPLPVTMPVAFHWDIISFLLSSWILQIFSDVFDQFP